MLFFPMKLSINRFRKTFRREILRGQKTIIETKGNLDKQGLFLKRAVRKLFEHRRAKAGLGGFLAILVLFGSVFSPPASALTAVAQMDNTVLAPAAVELTTKQTVRLPLDNLEITQGYSFFHPGLDLNGVTGDPVYPIMAGKVETIVYDRFGLGKHIIIAHGANYKSVYGHLSKIEVEVGQTVETKQVIGRVGSTGRSFGDHLHLEVFENERHINPRTILPL